MEVHVGECHLRRARRAVERVKQSRPAVRCLRDSIERPVDRGGRELVRSEVEQRHLDILVAGAEVHLGIDRVDACIVRAENAVIIVHLAAKLARVKTKIHIRRVVRRTGGAVYTPELRVYGHIRIRERVRSRS